MKFFSRSPKRRPVISVRDTRSEGWSWMRVLQSRWFMIIASLLLVLGAISLVKELMRQMEINQEITSLNDEITTLEGRNAELGRLIERLNSDVWQEKEARLKLGLQKEGEKVVALPLPSTPEKEETAQTLSETTPLASNPSLWFAYFFESSSFP